LGLIYRKDKALSKAALGFINVTLADADVAASSNGQPGRLSEVVKK
jgi:hypothetical protein